MTIRMFQDTRGQWRWSAVDRNGRVIADGSEGYDSEWNLRRALTNVMTEFRTNVQILFGSTMEDIPSPVVAKPRRKPRRKAKSS